MYFLNPMYNMYFGFINNFEYPGHVLERGDVGPPVRYIQEKLALFYDDETLLTKNGTFGPRTEMAVKSFQSDVGLPVTGKVDFATWEKLNQVTGYMELLGRPIYAPYTPAYPGHVLERGDVGPSVKYIQEKLSLFYNAKQLLTKSGTFGPQTEMAVKSFQSDVGLPITGKVDFKTWYKLGEVTGYRRIGNKIV